MSLSEKTRTRLVVLNVTLWFVIGIFALSLLGGPRGAVQTYLEPIGSELGGWFELALGTAGWNGSPLPRYELAIEPSVFRAAVLFDRSDGVEVREGSEGWWFPAHFSAEGVAYSVDLQLAGTASSPPRVRDQSWRVRFHGKQSYRGMHELDLVPADERHHAVELMVRDSAADMGLLAPPGGFAELAINGASTGTIFWSEGDSSAMLERLGYPKGEILTPQVSAGPIPAQLAGTGDELRGFAHYVPAIDRDGGRNVAEEKLARLLALAQNASDADFEQQAPELLDIEKFLNWNSFVWIFGDPDKDGFPATSWYFDPVTGLLEPIVRDFAPRRAIAAGAFDASDTSRLTTRLLSEPTRRARRNEILWSLVSHGGSDVVAATDEKLGSTLTGLAKSLRSLVDLGALRDYADLRRATRAALRERVTNLRTALAASQVETTPVLSVDAGTPTLTLTLEPAGLAEILLSEIRIEVGSTARANGEAAAVHLVAPNGKQWDIERAEPEVIGSSVTLRPEGLAMEPGLTASDADFSAAWKVEIRLPFLTPAEWIGPDGVQSIDVVYRNSVTGEALPPARLLTAEMLARTDAGDFRALLRPVEEVITESGLPFVLRGDELVLPAGDHHLAKTVVVPRSHRLTLDPGAVLHLGPDVSLISFRGLTAEGTPEQSIRIGAEDPKRPWGVIGVARAPEVSKLAFVAVSGGSRANFQGIDFDGQLSFNASDLVLADSEIHDSNRGDGLSLKRAAFDVSRTQFVSNAADGMDSEWSRGVVRESLFINNGDDGLDLADSEVNVEDCAFHWMGDKSISAGERSVVSVNSTRLSDSKIAIASKEDSRVDVSDTEFRRNHLGFSLYRSKPVFGGGSGSVTGGVFSRNDRDFSVEPGSKLELNHVQHETSPPPDALVGSLALRSVVTRSR